ncbi:hypothetical protein L1049_022958 [Liquidambar formosana]|uniref:C3H1-type domain-containing protein n=1 Tax=Liquidambar formosana TaxID=63359 RepID=A0AAP0RDB8_LIQFO
MEKSRFETPNASGTPFSFPPHRRSHLKSETFRSLVRILTHCYHDSQCSLATPIVSEKLTLDDGNDEFGQGAGKEACDEMVGPNGLEPGNMSIQKDIMVDDDIEVIGNVGRGPRRVEMAMDELKHIMGMEEYEEPVQVNSANLLSSSPGRNQTGNGAFALANNEEDYFDIQQFLMDESGNAEQVLVDSGHKCFEASKALELFLDKNITREVSKPGENNEDKSSALRMNVLEEVEHEMQQEEIKVVKSVCTSGTLVSPPRMTADEEIEEGEISGEFGVYDQSMDLLFEDLVALEDKKVENEQISEDVSKKNEVTCKDQKGENEKDSDASSQESNRNAKDCRSKMAVCGTPMKDKKADGYNRIPEAERNKKQDVGSKEGFKCLKACPEDLVLHGDILEENATDNRGITSTKQDDSVCNVKKRGRPSKEKKKRNKRMKRAEKNRQLGVKRLKLRPVVKPKTINYCQHYLQGRCQKGNECSFSHDTVPLTKSTPCRYFACKSCMKGDDCPFDHQLAKYPCDNYVSRGFCSRGDNCSFSHKMPLKDGSQAISNICKPELKSPSLLGNSNFEKQPNINSTSHQNVDNLSCSVGVFPRKNTKQNTAETLVKPPAQAPKGMNFLSFGKSPSDDSCKLEQAGSSQKGDNVKVGNQMNQGASDAVPNLNEIPKRTTPALAPEGINLLSFGKTSFDYCSSKKQATLPSNRDNGIDILPVDNSSKLKLAGSSPKRDVSVKVGIQMKQSISDSLYNMHEMTKRAPPKVPLGIKSLSFGKAPSEDSNSKQQTSMPFNRDNGIKIPVQERQISSEKLQNSSAMPCMLPVSPLAAGQSSGQLSDGHKNTPISAQKALLSTLSFAAKYESGMKMNRSIASLSSSSSSVSGSSQNDSRKASAILDFIYGVGSKTKQ